MVLKSFFQLINTWFFPVNLKRSDLMTPQIQQIGANSKERILVQVGECFSKLKFSETQGDHVDVRNPVIYMQKGKVL